METTDVQIPGADPREAEEVARKHFGLAAPSALALPGGRVNLTFQVESGGKRFILQRLNPFFQDDEVLGRNWRRIVEALEERAAPPLAPPIFPDLEGRWLALRPGWGGAWRLTGFRPGRPASKDPEGARSAALALGGLHQALNHPAPLHLLPLPEGEFTNQRLASEEELAFWPHRYRGHPHWPAILPLWERLADYSRALPMYPGFLDVFRLREVFVHGDPKADNFLLDQAGTVRTVLDWDTAGLGHFLTDVGEMLRSFGAAAGTEGQWASAAAVVEGYAEAGPLLTGEDVELLPAVWRALALNLGRRYLEDALAEVYFLWDQMAYPPL
jgi:Ser/Thr protein kinase RdoA (MazF antagonist)